MFLLIIWEKQGMEVFNYLVFCNNNRYQFETCSSRLRDLEICRLFQLTRIYTYILRGKIWIASSPTNLVRVHERRDGKWNLRGCVSPQKWKQNDERPVNERPSELLSLSPRRYKAEEARSRLWLTLFHTGRIGDRINKSAWNRRGNSPRL